MIKRILIVDDSGISRKVTRKCLEFAGYAQAEFVEAVRLKPSYAEAHFNLGLALHQGGKEQESLAEFDKAYEISPDLRNAPHP